MGKLSILLGIVLVTLVAETTCKKKPPPQLILPPLHRGPVRILPTYKPPLKRGHVVRTVREVKDPEPLWLYQDKNIDRAPSTGDHPVLPSIIDDIKLDPNRRTARSVDSPSAKRGGSSSRGSSRSSDTGPTHPGYNRRNARSVSIPPIFDPFTPSPTFPRPQFPGPRLPQDRRPLPIYARIARDVSIADVVRKPTHRDVIIPNWNPNARVNPWQRIGGNARRPRSVMEPSEIPDEDTNAVEYEE